MSGILNRLRKTPPQHKPAGVSQTVCQKPQGISWAMAGFLSVLLLASILSAVSFESRVRVYMAGEIAAQDVAADQNLRIEDRDATLRKRFQMAENQPPVFDLGQQPFDSLKKHVLEIFDQIHKPDEDLEKLRWSLSEDLNVEVGRDILITWKAQEFQELMSSQILPWLKDVYSKGVIGHAGQFGTPKNGILLRELPSGMETLLLETPSIGDLEQLKDDLDQRLKRDLKKTIRLRKAVFTLVSPFLRPNITFNHAATQDRKNEIMAAVDPVFYAINKGEVIVRQGERVTPEQQLKLQALYTHRRGSVQLYAVPGMFLLSGLFLVLLHLSQGTKQGVRCISDRDWMLMTVVIAMFVVLGKFVELVRVSDALVPAFLKSTQLAYGLPLAGAAGVLAMFLSTPLCSFAALLLSFMISNEVGGGLYLFSYYLLSSLVYIHVVKNCDNRQDVLRSIFPLGGLLLVALLGVNLVEFHGVEKAVAGGVYGIVNAVFSLLLVLGLSPILEMVFGYTSRFRLMELMSLEQPLLQELMVKAPGTYHHSIIVANMVEAGARSIGANALQAKVAALYHDVGKLKSPQYFIENLFGKENKHNKLSPSMSALILISHVKKGIELAKEHKLGQEIADLIGQHHGTTLIAYFYHKAQEQAEAKGEEPVREDEFRYPGPKPQTKEAGLILLADAIEASSRTLVDPTPSRIKGHIQSIVRKIYTEGQLDDSELTLKELTSISDTFHRILTGIFHHRIEYPNMERKDKAKETVSAAASEKTAASAERAKEAIAGGESAKAKEAAASAAAGKMRDAMLSAATGRFRDAGSIGYAKLLDGAASAIAARAEDGPRLAGAVVGANGGANGAAARTPTVGSVAKTADSPAVGVAAGAAEGLDAGSAAKSAETLASGVASQMVEGPVSGVAGGAAGPAGSAGSASQGKTPGGGNGRPEKAA